MSKSKIHAYFYGEGQGQVQGKAPCGSLGSCLVGGKEISTEIGPQMSRIRRRRHSESLRRELWSSEGAAGERTWSSWLWSSLWREEPNICHWKSNPEPDEHQPSKCDVAFDFSSLSPPSSPGVWERGKAEWVKEEAGSPQIMHYLWMDGRVFILSLDFLYLSLNQDGFDSQSTEDLLSSKSEQQALGTNWEFIRMQRKIYGEVVRKFSK